MKEIVLNTMSGKQVSFVGELVKESTGSIDMPDNFDRQFGLRLYDIESGGFVPSIEYTSNAPHEHSGCLAEIVDLPKDVENFFFVFVADDLLEESQVSDREDKEVRKKLVARLRASYEDLMSIFLEEITQALDKDAEPPEPQTTDANKIES